MRAFVGILLLVSPLAAADVPPLVLPAERDIPRAEPAPAEDAPRSEDEVQPVEIQGPRRAEKARRLGVTIFPIIDPGLPSDLSAAVVRGLSEALRENRRLDMKDLDLRLSDFAQETPLDQIDLARAAYEEGVQALASRQAQAAAARLKEAVDQLLGVLPYIKKQELADAMMALAIAYAARGQRRMVNATLIRLLTWRSDYEVDAARLKLEVPPRVTEALEAARRAVSRLSRGRLEVMSEPPGARVFIDGTYVGTTPAAADDLLAGEHYLTFRKIGFRKTLYVAQVSARMTERVSVRLAPSEKYLLVRQAMERIERTLGAPRLDPVADNLRETLLIDHGVFLKLADAGPMGATRAEAYLYDLRSRALIGRREVHIAAAAHALPRTAELAVRLYEGVDYEGALRPPVDLPPPRAARTPFYRKWWFLSTASVMAAAALAIGLGVGLGRTPGCPDGSVCTGPLVY